MATQPFIPPWQRRRPLPPAKPRVSNETGKTASGGTPYQLGKKFEVAIKSRLERRGYFVMRAYGSKGKVDLLAIGMPCLERGATALFIQCKRRGSIGSAEWNELYELAQRFGAWPVVCTKLSERTVGFYRLDIPREPRKPGRPWTLFDPSDLSEQLPPPELF